MMNFNRMLTAFGVMVACSESHAASLNYSGTLGQSDWIKMITGLFLIVTLILLFSWLVKKIPNTHWRSSTGFRPVGGMVLGPKEKMMLIQVGGRYLLIGVTPASIGLVYDFGEQRPEGFECEEPSKFAALLKSALVKS